MGVKVVAPGCCYQSPIIPHSQTLLRRARSFHRPSRAHTIIRSCSASLDPSSSSFSSFSFDEDFLTQGKLLDRQIHDNLAFATAMEPSFLVPPVPPAWHGRAGEETVIQRKANSVEIPLSLRIIKRKLKWEENLTDAGESAYCSMKKAFSSMVFIVRELHSYSLLQMREAVSSTRGDLQSTLARVHRELHASFVWLFQSVFSHTPALMVSVMILLANFSVYSMDSHVAAAAPPPLAAEVQIAAETKYFDSSSPSSRLTVSLDNSNVAFFGGDGGRGGSSQPLASGTEGDGVGAAESRPATAREDEEASELRLWNEIVDEARRMEASASGVVLDAEIVKRFVSPVTARIEPDDVADYFRTELVYQVWLTQDPNNPLLLANYAQFLYLVAHDYDRAEEYFKRAVKVEPKDAEAISKYASFLWMARKDLWAAEETFLEAISADPNNSFYAANYAHFLWNTGGEDTCFPLASPDQEEL